MTSRSYGETAAVYYIFGTRIVFGTKIINQKREMFLLVRRKWFSSDRFSYVIDSLLIRRIVAWVVNGGAVII